MPTASQSLQDATRTQYQMLHDLLKKARESCVDGSGADLRHKANQVQSILTALDQEDVRSRTADFEALGAHIAEASAGLQVLKAQVGKIVQDVAVATKIVSAIDSAATAAGKMFA